MKINFLFVALSAPKLFRASLAVLASGLILFGIASTFSAQGQTKTPNSEPRRNEKIIKFRASGTFEVKVTPSTATGETANLVRLLLQKQFHGDLEGSGKGEMLTVDNGSKTSGGCVAIELISGALNNRKGTFALQHSGTMTGDKMELSIKVVPDSGTGELAGLAGEMTIKIEGNKHSFDFQYSLPERKVGK